MSRDLDEALIDFIESAKTGDAIRGCFYEFAFRTRARRAEEGDRPRRRRQADRRREGQRAHDPAHPEEQAEKPAFVQSTPREGEPEAIGKAELPDKAIIPREARRDDIQHNKFMVLLKGKTARKPTEVWTGSTNLTDGGIYGQANVGHRVRNEQTARLFVDYWNILAGDPGAPTDATKERAQHRVPRRRLQTLTPAPTKLSKIPAGITPLFSPRSNMTPIDLYVQMLAKAKSLSCGTFAFGIPAEFRTAIGANTKAGHSASFSSRRRTSQSRPRPTPSPSSFSTRRTTPTRRAAQNCTRRSAAGSPRRTTRSSGSTSTSVYTHLKFMLTTRSAPTRSSSPARPTSAKRQPPRTTKT